METTADTATQEVKTFDIPKYYLSVLEKRIKKLGRRAKRLKIEAPSYEVIREYNQEIKIDSDKRKLCVRFLEVAIHGPTVKAKGWSFVASIEHTPAGNAIKKVPGYDGEIPHEYREGWPVCNHCNTKRRRKSSFLCVNPETGEWKQVGRNCLAEFLGVDPSTVVWGLDFWLSVSDGSDFDNDDDFYLGGGGGALLWVFDFLEFMTAVFHCVRTEGWCSRHRAENMRDQGTADAAWWIITPAKGKELELKEAERRNIKPEDEEKAVKALEWGRQMLEEKGVERRSDYEQNLYIALSKPDVEHNDIGIVASLAVVYCRFLEKEIKRKTTAPRSNEWLWKEGERVRNVSLRIVSQRSFLSSYGAVILHRMEDEKGNMVVWWGSSYLAEKGGKEAEIGDTVVASWRVKNHDTYQGRKQTVVTRPTKIKVVDEENEDENDELQ